MTDLKAYYDARYDGSYRDVVTGFEVARWRALAHVLLHAVPASDVREILDYGCGSGLHLPLWADVFPQARISCADISAKALEKLIQRYPAYDGRCREITDDQVDFPSGQFDLIVSVEVMEHVEDLTKYLAEVHRLLRPGGCFVWTTPCGNRGSIEHLFALLSRQIQPTAEGYRRWAWEDAGHVRRLRSREAAERLRAVGFASVDFRFRSHLFSFVCSNLCRGPLWRVGEELMTLDYALFRRLPNGASMIGIAHA